VGYDYPTAWIANVFTAKSAETLKAVSFYTTDSTCSYEVYIYTSPESGPISQKGPLVSKSGKISAAGYHTVPLDSEVQLKAGQNFSVVLKLTTPNYNYPIAIEMPYAGLSSKAKANSGESFVSSDGSTWDDMTTHFSNTNVCIKAFTVSGNTLPIANFSSNVTSGNAPLSVQFMDLSKNAKSWNWDFGDGTNSIEKNPMHTYFTAGTYTVNLTATNTKGTDSKSATIIVSSKPVPPVANFSNNVTSGNAPLYVQFIDLSQNATSWNWNFGDGATSDQQQPIHIYSTAGTYIVNLTAGNAHGTDSKLATITVTAKQAPPDAAFTSSPTTGKAPLAVQFTDLSKGSPAKWYWDFGDRGTSTYQNPMHTYSKAGIYTVKLIVSNDLGSNKVIKPNYIIVTNAQKKPAAGFRSNVTTGNAPLNVAFSNASTGSPTSWKWTFGDGGTSKEMNPIHTYTRAGKYTVSLTVSNAAGSSTVINPGYIVVNFLKRPRW
jgi:PKD repeat protein